jgi:hypothetical protein
VYWAYNTGGTIGTSVTLSADGSQMAFVQAAPTTNSATLVLLKWKSSTTETAAAPMTLSSTALGSYRSCTAPCMTTMTFSGTTTPTDSYSAPYYDFSAGSDTLYVGDDSGFLHQFTGVFNGTPAETTSTWPVHAATAKLSSPVFDNVTGNVFVTTSYTSTGNSGARLAAVCATSTCAGVNNGNVTTAIGTVTPSLVLGPTKTASVACHGTGASGNANDLRLDSPIIDSTAGKVYAFLGNDGNGNSAVLQFPTAVSSTQFSWHSCGTSESIVGTGSATGIPLLGGTFDNVYYTSSSGSSPSGNLYVCGNTSGNATLYQIQINSGATSTITTGLAVSTANTTCSPLTEVFSASTDLIFLSVESAAPTSGAWTCTSAAGCLMSFTVPGTVGGTMPAKPTATLAASGGTSGIVIDNTVAPGITHTSQVYYSTLGNQSCTGGTGGCAVQASQAALQ